MTAVWALVAVWATINGLLILRILYVAWDEWRHDAK